MSLSLCGDLLGLVFCFFLDVIQLPLASVYTAVQDLAGSWPAPLLLSVANRLLEILPLASKWFPRVKIAL
jgi:hypothetical protein